MAVLSIVLTKLECLVLVMVLTLQFQVELILTLSTVRLQESLASRLLPKPHLLSLLQPSAWIMPGPPAPVAGSACQHRCRTKLPLQLQPLLQLTPPRLKSGLSARLMRQSSLSQNR